MHDGLVDHAFGVAPGKWTMQRCISCGCGYLDPRPTQATIGLAYADYYTHQQGEPTPTPLARLRRAVALSYVNSRYGTRFAGSLQGSYVLAWVLPRLRRYLDVMYARHLSPADATGGRLLDVGCGNGEFLACAAAMGWDAEGIDPDQAAIAAATALGCRARQATLDDPGLQPGAYRHITLSHVIEHVPSPSSLLSRCFALLAPGGRLWLETPNVDGLGHRVFGASWRGLEPPRHLVLFNREALTGTLARAGFTNIKYHCHPAISLFIWETSRAIARSESGSPQVALKRRIMQSLWFAVIADYWSTIRPAAGDFLTCVAYRPSERAVCKA